MPFPKNGTVVVADGACADGSSWKEVILLLSKQGLQVVAAPLPLTSLSDEIVALNRTIVRTKGPVIVAEHAYAGAVIAAANDERVKALVYVYHSRPNDSASEIRSTPRSSLRGRKDYREKANFRRTNRAFYRSRRAAKVLLAALRSTLTVLDPRMRGLYQFALEQQWLIWQRPMHLAGPLSASSRSTFSGHAPIRLLPNTAIIAEFRRILKVARGCRSP